MPCILNAANEIAVAAFLKDEIKFLDIQRLIEGSMEKATFIEKPTLEQYLETDKETRAIASELK